jgi:KaiC/GvpD/RAD55 family RecA-like ATPase
MLGGGVKLGSLAFVVCDASPLRDRFLTELAINGMRRGYGVVYVSTDRPGKSIEQDIAAKVPKSTYTNQMYIIDTVSVMLEDRYIAPLRYVSVPNDFSSIDKRIDEGFVTLKKKGILQQILIFDSVDKVLRITSGYMNVYKVLLSISMLLEGYSAPGLFSIDARMHSAPSIRALNELASTFIILDPSKGVVTTIVGGKKTESGLTVKDGLLYGL